MAVSYTHLDVYKRQGQHGVCEALREAGRDGKVRVIAYDVTPQNIDELRQGTISILIDQTAREQGSRPLMLLRDFILYGLSLIHVSFTRGAPFALASSVRRSR